jgi:glutaredoxin
MQRRRVVLYTKAGCHLCDIAKERLARVRREQEFDLEEVDIAGDPGLLERFGTRIPVVTIDGEFAFEHRVVVDEMLTLLRGQVLLGTPSQQVEPSPKEAVPGVTKMGEGASES